MQNKSIFVTGGHGFFGSFIVPALTHAGYTVFSYDKRDTPVNDILNWDILLLKMKNHDAVLHMAAIPHFYEKELESRYIETNILGTIYVANAARELKIKNFVYISSGSVYGFALSDKGFINKDPINEQHAYNLLSGDSEKTVHDLDPYGRSKLLCEAILKTFYPKLRVTVLRVNMIEPMINRGDHFDWHCKQETLCNAILASLKRTKYSFEVVNVGEEPNENMDFAQLHKLLNGEL